MVFQPLVDLRNGRLLGIEALARFPDGVSPLGWFADADRLGQGLDLELSAIGAALAEVRIARATLPAGITLCVNASPATICAPEFGELVADAPLPVTVEVPWYATVADHACFLSAVSALRTAGVRLAVDDVVADHASFQRVLQWEPDVVKIDMSLTCDIDRDVARRELARSVSRLTRHICASLVAEGVERRSEADALLSLGVTAAQGYALGRPEALSEVASSVAVPTPGPTVGLGH